MNEELNEEIKITKIELGDRKQEYDILHEEKEDERKEKLQLQQVVTLGLHQVHCDYRNTISRGACLLAPDSILLPLKFCPSASFHRGPCY